ncbi:MAG: glycosyltransferase family 4 protein [Lachnospiraceae bacterium]
MKKRILSITAQKPNSTGSGVYLTELVKAWAKEGHEQAVIAGVEATDTVTLPEGCAFYPVYFKSEELPFPVVGMSDVMPYDNTRYCDLTRDMQQQFCEAFSRRVKAAIREFCPDLILCHHLYLVTALTVECVEQLCLEGMDSIPVYGLCHSTCLRQFQKNELRKEFIRDKICSLSGCFALHSGQKQEIVDIFGIPEEKVEILGAGYNEELFFTPDDIPVWSSDHRPVRLCFAGKVSQAKGVGSLLRSVSDLAKEQPVKLFLAGGNGDEKELNDLEKQADIYRRQGAGDLEIRFVGKLAQEELAGLYRSCDIFVLPSFYEGLPLTLIEAMACGCLAVAADWTGVPDWIGQRLPEAEISYVRLPRMEKPGVPAAEGLPDYEARLTQALRDQIGNWKAGAKQTDVTGLSWRKIGESILVHAEREC